VCGDDAGHGNENEILIVNDTDMLRTKVLGSWAYMYVVVADVQVGRDSGGNTVVVAAAVVVEA